jgi:hypothetical protein
MLNKCDDDVAATSECAIGWEPAGGDRIQREVTDPALAFDYTSIGIRKVPRMLNHLRTGPALHTDPNSP